MVTTKTVARLAIWTLILIPPVLYTLVGFELAVIGSLSLLSYLNITGYELMARN